MRSSRTNSGVLGPSSIERHPIRGGGDRDDQTTKDGERRPQRGNGSKCTNDCRSPDNLINVNIDGNAPIQWVQRADVEEGDERVCRDEQNYGDDK